MRVEVRGGEVEQAATVAAALRRGGLAVADADDVAVDLVLTLGPAPRRLRLDPVARAAWLGDRRIRLTAIEFALLAALRDAPGGLDRTTLLARIWGCAFDPGTNLVAVHVHRLRAKIGHARIAARAGGGYLYREGEGELVGATGFEPATPRPPV